MSDIEELIEIYENNGMKVLLAAPTEKAIQLFIL